jgi:hypothetical protein
MARLRQSSSTGKIFENILFLAEVFGDRLDEDIPPLPVLEMAKCFELTHPRRIRLSRRRLRDWPLWR